MNKHSKISHFFFPVLGLLSSVFCPRSSSLELYYHTLRHLKAGQIYARLIRKLRRPQVDSRPAPDIRTGGRQDWVQPVKRPQSMLGPATFCFLNQTHTLHWPQGWNDPGADKLWLYNLHYFDDLHAQGAEERTAWRHRLLLRWVDENPPGKGNGWEPYPTSLRVVNWIKWALAGNTLPEAAVHSLAVQVRWLGKHLEYHLLGNHLFANAKALVFAGAFFEGQEARQWMDKGLAILAREIPEQILPDGGHFERSPMYHAIAVEDMADLVNICRAYPHSLPQQGHELVRSWPDTVQRMLEWLQTMCHPDGNIVLLNDAALNIAPEPKQLAQYCQRLGIRPASRESGERLRVTQLPDTGYIRVDAGEAVAFLDTAPIGPDYLPGHAHADNLSLEMSYQGSRVLVDTGTGQYREGPERIRQRGTAAHNTVRLDGQDSSEVWGSFRVARRAYPIGRPEVEESGAMLQITAGHDGYKRLPGRPEHWRRLVIQEKRVEVIDILKGKGVHTVEVFWHFHPDIVIEKFEEKAWMKKENQIIGSVCIQRNFDIEIQDSMYCQEFGGCLNSKVICHREIKNLPVIIKTIFEFI